jgi:regulator of protease activity HflC (stomatin/prohibitin superfamily)
MNQVQQLFEYFFNAVKIWVIVMPWETGLRIRYGKKVKNLSKGIYFRLPYFDSVYIQESRLRVISLATQTITTLDGKTITLNGAVGYSVTDINKLYDNLYHPETTISNMVMSEVSTFICSKDYKDISHNELEESILNGLKELDYGLEFTYFKVTNFAVVKTFRLIQDQNFYHEGLSMNESK